MGICKGKFNIFVKKGVFGFFFIFNWLNINLLKFYFDVVLFWLLFW